MFFFTVAATLDLVPIFPNTIFESAVSAMITQLDESLKPLLVFSTIALAFVVHRYVMHTRVRWQLLFIITRKLMLYLQASKTFAAQHGCKPMRSIFPYKWPFALDLLYNQYQVNKTQRLLASQTPFFNELGPNIKLSLLGETGFLTFHPENLEAILSTKFDGLYYRKFQPSTFQAADCLSA